MAADVSGENQPMPDDAKQLVRPNRDLVAELLDQMELTYGVDDEGDLVAPYEGFRIYFIFRGTQHELFAMRTYYDRVFPLESKPVLLGALDAWNRETLWPKAYTLTQEDGSVRMVTEYQLIVPNRVDLNFFVSNMTSWMEASIQFDGWIADQLGWDGDLDDPDD
ncbi:hypothetical protein NRB56_39190 [Nocardia sp. RB56]|uniref:YbjN domain-containing protein n=2 Tax=Nocardia aurantia TaxID=2585199 RepID=A0A7K0DRJ3_9NOCA|nr:hypothetical protein [Nocardia aurantia]